MERKSDYIWFVLAFLCMLSLAGVVQMIVTKYYESGRCFLDCGRTMEIDRG